jgi:hypothetical protein
MNRFMMDLLLLILWNKGKRLSTPELEWGLTEVKQLPATKTSMKRAILAKDFSSSTAAEMMLQNSVLELRSNHRTTVALPSQFPITTLALEE